MNVSLTPQLEAFVAESVKKGRYQTASEVVREALRLMQEKQAANEAKLGYLRDAIARSDADVAAGRFTTIETEDEHRAFHDRILSGAVARVKAKTKVKA